MTWWDSFDTLSKLQTALAILVSVLGFVTLTVKLRADQLKKQADARRVAERALLDEELKGKTAEALRATAALEARQAPRALAQQQRDDLLNLLANGPKGKVIVQSDWTDAEAKAFAEQIKSVLQDAGFEIVPVTLQVLTLLDRGAFIFLRDKSQPPPHALFIQQSFTKVGITLPADTATDGMQRCAPSEAPNWSLGLDTVILWVATKP